MPKRTICIQNPAKISVRLSSLVVAHDGCEARIPLEDIGVVILETKEALITAAALSALMSSGAVVMTCDECRLPNGYCLPYGSYFRPSEVIDLQLAMGRPLQKQLWSRIVRQKIENQARVLDLLELDGIPVRNLAQRVLSDDSSNREGVAAAIYFKSLLPQGTRREGPYAASLDYGYGVLRAAIARSIGSAGWLSVHGLHHHGPTNAFNLVDDLIEPFRPIVDLLVVKNDLCGDLAHSVKAKLASVLTYLVGMPRGNANVETAVEMTVASLKRAVAANDPQLLELPFIIPLQQVMPE